MSPGARARAERGELAFGTIDCFLLWRLTGGAVHATDVTNASRTSLFDIRAQSLGRRAVPAVRRARGDAARGSRQQPRLFGTTAPGLFDAQIPIAGMAGDQQAALFGQACFAPGMAKSTYGTGCFLLLNTGDEAVALAAPAADHARVAAAAGGPPTRSKARSSSPGRRSNGCATALGVIADAAETDSLAPRGARQSRRLHGPGLRRARRAALGPGRARRDLRADPGRRLRAHLARAALEAVAYQTLDLIEAMAADGAARPADLRLDGGMAANAWLCQFLADILQVPVERPRTLETTALGAAFHAGLATGVWPDLKALAGIWRQQDAFQPRMAPDRRDQLIDGWKRAVAKTVSRA